LTLDNVAQAQFPSPHSLGHSSHHSVWSTISGRTQQLPEYVSPLPASLNEDDINYLQKKGALTLPDSQLRDECLMGYLSHVHPFYPVCSFRKVKSLLSGTIGNDEKISLLLLQVLIFAGSSWADVKLVRRSGFLTRRAFREATHQKVRLLYDVDYENDRLCLVQSLILLSFWWKGADQLKDAFHYLSIAQIIARTIGLHKAASDVDMDPAFHKIRRRVWWSLIIRHIICSFGLSRAPVYRECQQIPMLCQEDFNYDDSNTGFQDPVLLHSAPRAYLLARICIAHAQLVMIFGRILIEACPEESLAGRTTALYASQQMNGVPESETPRQLNTKQLADLEIELMRWREQLADDLWHTGGLPAEMTAWSQAEYASKAYIAVMYHAAYLTLHRPQMLPLKNQYSSLYQNEDSSRLAVRQAAGEITTILMEFFNADIVTSVSSTCLSCILPAAISCVFDLVSEDSAVRAQASQMLEGLKAIIQEFSEPQWAPEWMLKTIEHIQARVEQQNRGDGQNLFIRSECSSRESDEKLPLMMTTMDSTAAVGLPGASKVQSMSHLPQPIKNPCESPAGNGTAVCGPSASLSQLLPDEMAYNDLDEMWSDFVWAPENLFGSLQSNSDF
jgi:hypothetical protein